MEKRNKKKKDKWYYFMIEAAVEFAELLFMLVRWIIKGILHLIP
ncbi:hypothetical protein [Bacillus testis]|nr:hypothetical protein [Bacillus testis]